MRIIVKQTDTIIINSTEGPTPTRRANCNAEHDQPQPKRGSFLLGFGIGPSLALQVRLNKMTKKVKKKKEKSEKNANKEKKMMDRIMYYLNFEN